MLVVLLTVLTATAAAALITGIVRDLVLRRGLLDVPNERSSHHQPTARGGGAAIVVVVLASVAFALWRGDLDARLGFAALLGGAAVAGIGFLDDHAHVPAPLRLLVHFVALAGALAVTGGLHAIPWGGGAVDLGLAGDVLACLACVWFLNLFNFMDGIDGIAAAESAFIAFAAAWLAAGTGAPASLVTLWLVTGAASLGFLAWNWPPARIFMGDVGSGFLGFVLPVLLVYTTGRSGLNLWTALILGAPFVADATVTLLARIARGERWYSAHRSHAYQWLARRWGSHARVTGLFIILNATVVLPAAWWSVQRPQQGPLLAAAVLVALGFAARAAGAGRPEVVASHD